MEEEIPKSVPEYFSELFGFEAKQKQLEAIIKIMENKDSNVFVALPTGWGKSMCYLAPPIILDKMDPITNGRHIAIIISPLRSLMADQVKRCEVMGIKACWYQPDSTPEEIKGVKSAAYSVVFSSPESAVTDSFKDILLSKQYRQQLCLLAFDEAHCISQWGLDFRPAYRKVHVLVSLVNVPILCLTATVTNKILDDVLEVLAVQKEDLTLVASLPDRPNIFINLVYKSGMQPHKELGWYIDHLKTQREKAKKAIVFCRTLGDVQRLFMIMNQGLGGNLFVSKERKQNTRLVDVYFADSVTDNQSHIMEYFPKIDSNLRCLICTNAFGIGVEIPDVDLVIHWGVPTSILSYWQEVGRCGRDGRYSEAHLMATKRSVVQTPDSGPSNDIVQLCKTGDDGLCLREQILSNLYLDGMDPFHPPIACNAAHQEHIKLISGCICPACLCCSVCRQKCPCRSKNDKN